jgi:hypothetical protein
MTTVIKAANEKSLRMKTEVFAPNSVQAVRLFKCLSLLNINIMIWNILFLK